MASIVNRGSHYYVVYLYDDERTGKKKQKWESYPTIEAAKARKTEVEYKQTAGTYVVPVYWMCFWRKPVSTLVY